MNGGFLRSLTLPARLWLMGVVIAGVGSILAAAALAQEAEYEVKFHEPKTDVAAIVLPVEGNQRIQIQYTGMMGFGLMIDNTKYLCCGAGAIRTNFKIDGQIHYPNNVGNIAQPLPPDRFGRPRPGTQTSFNLNGLQVTQQLEVIPSKPAPGALKRPLDNCLIRYIFENKSDRVRNVGTRVRIDTMCGNNDGALFASPTTHKDQVLNGIELKDKTLPEYVMIMEQPNVKNPGFHGHFTLKLPGNRIGPDRFLCTTHAIGDNGWDTPVQQAVGDSDCVLFWTPRDLKPGEKIEMAYAYGQGLASLPESEGRVKINLGGNFEPGKMFTISAFVEDPARGQSLTLELPDGMTLLDGARTQPATTPSDTFVNSAVLWKARVDRPGEYALRIRSSNGITETRTVTIAKRP